MKIEGGTYVVPVLINNAITLDFVVDSGAADVSIPADVVMTLMRTRTIRESDFLGEKTYVLADGSEVPSQTFRIRSLKIGSTILENVRGSIAPVKGSLLLGQSFLGRFKSWSIDNGNHALLLSEDDQSELDRQQTGNPRSTTNAQITSLLRNSLGQWAIGDPSDCQIPSKSYSLTRDAGNIIWRDGVGNVDIESVVYDDDTEFRSVTVKSIYKSSSWPPGTNWTYLKIGVDRMQVTSNGRNYVLSRCQ